MYDIGLPSGKTLYQMQAERILRVQEMAKKLTRKEVLIPMYIMTSEHTKKPTMEFFMKHNYFGLSKKQLHIFEQRTIPCFDMQVCTHWYRQVLLDYAGKVYYANKVQASKISRW